MNSEVQIQKQKPKKKTIFDDRLYLTNNYVIDGNSNKEVSSSFLYLKILFFQLQSFLLVARGFFFNFEKKN